MKKKQPLKFLKNPKNELNIIYLLTVSELETYKMFLDSLS